MARWVWPAVTGVATSATGVAINLATEWRDNPWAWVAVVALTGLGVAAALRVQTTPPDEAKPREVHNEAPGPVGGPLIQSGSIGTVHTTVNQTATAHGGSTIHQAGRDMTVNTGEPDDDRRA